MQNTDMRLESGTCNVCSAPCSSCMHLNHALMGSKAEEFSDESCRVGEANNQYSMDEGNVYSLRSRACESSQHALSETSNMLSANSSHGSLSENAQSRQMSSNKYQDSKYLEVHDDNTSCISRASDPNVVNDSYQRNAEGINISCSSASVSHLMAEGSGSVPSVNVSGLSEIPTSKDEDTGHSSPKVQSLFGQSRSGKSLSGIPSLKHVERDSRSHTPEKLSECSIKNSSSSFSKEREPIVVSGEKSIANKDCHIDGTTNVSLKVCPKTEADTDNDVCDDKDEDHKCSVHDGPHEKAEELVKSPAKQEPQSEDENDESDVMEHDIKVCDICGDAGREDLLAICSRCSDGAEHTYCMKEMLEKVPEGEWLCEECKDAEETENKRLDVEGKKILEVSSTSQVSGKRLSDNIEVAPAAKRQALESSTGLPKASSPKRLVTLSRESSFKSLDKLKAKPALLMPTHNHSGVDDTEIARSTSIGPQGQIPKSMLLKSKSFNINSKPKVKLVDEVVPRKLKGVNEKTSKNMETPARMTSKSTLFKSSSLGRSSATEPKVKMLSPKSATASELKGSRHLKESGSFDRKFPSRNDRPVASSVLFTPKGDQRLTPRGDTPKPSTVINSRELKVNHDGKLSAKSTSNISRKSLDRQDSSERTSTSVDEALQDVPPRSRETANQVEKTRDSSSDRVMPVVPAASKSSFCQKCKEFGHPPECCTAGSTQESGAEISATTSSSSKEDMHKGNRLKAAIQAALLRRPEIYKKKEVPNQTDEVSTLGTELNCEVALQDQLLVSSTLKNSISAEDTHEQQEILENSTSDSSKCSSANDLKQLNSSRTDFCSQPGKSDSIGLAAGKPVARSLSHKAMSSVLSKMLAIPEYEYIWQGDFEVHRNGKPPDLCTGVQAHLSSCASPKVLEVVNKFPPEVPVNEVPRLSTWPSQFLQGGVREDNIALYFFARDIESYERHYKGLLDHMIRNDLALKGIFDGVELLIFPSNQLPENLQRWNMLFFLWGVFRGRRISLSDSAEKICIPSLNVMPVEENSSSVVATLSEMHCLPKCMDEESIDCDKACNAVLPSTSVGQCQITKASVLQHSKPPEAMGTSVCTSGIVETKTDSHISVKRENTLYLAIPSVGSQERGAASNISKEIFLERMNSHEDQPRPTRKQKENCHYIDLEATIYNEERSAASNISKDKSSERMNSDEYLLRPRKQEDDHYIDLEATVGNQETSAASNISKDKILEKMDGNEDQLWLKKKPKKDDHYIDLEATFQEDLAVEGINWQLSSDKEVQYVDLSDRVMQASAFGSQKMPWNEVNGKLKDGESSSKKLKTDFSGIYGCYSTVGRDSFNDSFAPLATNPGSCSSVEDKVCEEACDEKIICEDLGTMERTFFPIGTQNISDSQSMLNSMSLKGLPEFEDRFQDGIPNLELALGGETKALPPPAPKAMLPFLVGAVDRKNNRPDSLADGKEDDGVAASLSLSLSVPSSNKEHSKAASKAELLPDGHRVNTSLFLFGRFTDK
ncbi:protein PARALOG OF AIPP2-like isoform X2 [Gastrolobium bilobum]|uniref:protein PARALOG OF AIPP2-like isoform X2 n=1 Tax=Gastrolobium bilobum TaxID=150636 RepID=UPI002AB2BDA0|nr:protein PARALOG OF AIPP2-like isoform X2 [Gastrolobium bilobum]